MCGIAGLVSVDRLAAGDVALVDEMLGTLSHRGPDEQRCAFDDHAVLGARRLSVIDLDTGSQPIGSDDGRIQTTQNGEIYNYLELREMLAARGRVLRTNGDTETIGLLYEEFGDSFVEHLRGMFAIAIWDAPRQRLVLVRDRLGKKPLYWYERAGRLIYGSELKALIRDPSTPGELDRTALARYLQYQYIPAPATILCGVRKLEAGSMLVWERGTVAVRRFWRPTYTAKRHRPFAEDLAEGASLLREAVGIRLRSDVPVGLFLSGGLDSSTVLALMSEASATQVRTFSIRFEDADYDERRYARAVASHFDADHHEEVVRLDVIGMLPALATHFDEPFGDSSAIPTYRVAQIAAQHVRVVLTGDGGDEVFGGYDRYRKLLALRRLARLPGPVRRQAVRARTAARRALTDVAPPSEADTTLAAIIDLSLDEQFVRLSAMADLRLRRRLMRDDPLANQDGYLLELLRSGPVDPVDRMLAADTASYLPEDLLVKTDRATMAHSLEARAPLLDQEVVSFAARLPADRKLRRGTTKVVLRAIARTLMPDTLIDRPKYGFAAPLVTWFRSDLADVYRDLVLAPDSHTRDHLDSGVASWLLEEHLRGSTDQARRLWLLLALELWARRWLPAGASSS